MVQAGVVHADMQPSPAGSSKGGRQLLSYYHISLFLLPSPTQLIAAGIMPGSLATGLSSRQQWQLLSLIISSSSSSFLDLARSCCGNHAH